MPEDGDLVQAVWRVRAGADQRQRDERRADDKGRGKGVAPQVGEPLGVGQSVASVMDIAHALETVEAFSHLSSASRWQLAGGLHPGGVSGLPRNVAIEVTARSPPWRVGLAAGLNGCVKLGLNGVSNLAWA